VGDGDERERRQSSGREEGIADDGRWLRLRARRRRGDVLGLGEGGGLTGWLQFLLGRYIWPVPCGPQGI
jgi:hypothetical protein